MDFDQINSIHWASYADNEPSSTMAEVMDYASGGDGEESPSQEDLDALQELMDKVMDFAGCEAEAAQHGFEFVKNGFVPVGYDNDDWT